MRTFHGFCIGLGAWALVGWAPAEAGESQAGCKLGKFVELAVTMQGPVPITKIDINGTEARFVVDSGAFLSTMSSASAAELRLESVYGSLGLGFSAAGGSVKVAFTTVRTLTIAGADLHNIPFLVGGSAVGGGAAGVIGQNILHLTDVEYDLANGVVRMMRPVDCNKTALAYWATAPTPYSMIDIEQPHGLNYQAIATVHVNGIGVRAMFDTGAASSLLSLRAAARAGIKPGAPGVVPAGWVSGFGQGDNASYIAPFGSFKVGDEEIKNAKLRIADFGVKEVDMLLGADFFLSHRIYVANGQHKLYFTYNGGPVFDLTVHGAPAVAAPTPTVQAATEAPATPVQAASLVLPPDEHDQDAAALSRRGDAAAARGDMAGAIAALNRACELAPQNPDYFLQRALVLQKDKQPDLALADYWQCGELVRPRNRYDASGEDR